MIYFWICTRWAVRSYLFQGHELVELHPVVGGPTGSAMLPSDLPVRHALLTRHQVLLALADALLARTQLLLKEQQLT